MTGKYAAGNIASQNFLLIAYFHVEKNAAAAERFFNELNTKICTEKNIACIYALLIKLRKNFQSKNGPKIYINVCPFTDTFDLEN